MKNTISYFAFSAVAAGLFFWAGASNATSININNPSFESNVLSNGNFVATIANWTIGPSIEFPGGAPVGTFNPTASQYPGGLVPDGQNVAYSKDGTISQVLTATLTANTIYTLKVDIGHRNDNPDFMGYSVQLRAGGVTLASESSLVPARGAFLTSTVSFSTGASNTLFGQPLQILLDVIPQGNLAYQVNFDNVRLDYVSSSASTISALADTSVDASVSAVPEPSSFAFFAFGIAGLALVRRRLK